MLLWKRKEFCFGRWNHVILLYLQVESFETDFTDGTLLAALVEKLQRRRLRYNKRPQNQHHEIENITIALDAVKEDGIRLVNIGEPWWKGHVRPISRGRARQEAAAALQTTPNEPRPQAVA